MGWNIWYHKHVENERRFRFGILHHQIQYQKTTWLNIESHHVYQNIMLYTSNHIIRYNINVG